MFYYCLSFLLGERFFGNIFSFGIFGCFVRRWISFCGIKVLGRGVEMWRRG